MVNNKKYEFTKPTIEECISFLEICKKRTESFDMLFPDIHRDIIEKYACFVYSTCDEIIKILQGQE